MKKFSRVGLVVVATIGLLIATAETPAFAEASSPQSPEVAARAFLADYGVSLAAQDALLDRYADGISWESFTSGSVPTSSNTFLALDPPRTEWDNHAH